MGTTITRWPSWNPRTDLMKRSVLMGALVAALIFPGLPVSAFPLCLGGLAFTPGQQLDVADQAVLAAPVAGGTQWRIIEVVKAATPVGPLIAEPVEGADGAAARAGQPSLLLRHAQWPRWSSVGTSWRGGRAGRHGLPVESDRTIQMPHRLVAVPVASPSPRAHRGRRPTS